jgi:hypothetical protein
MICVFHVSSRFAGEVCEAYTGADRPGNISPSPQPSTLAMAPGPEGQGLNPPFPTSCRPLSATEAQPSQLVVPIETRLE